MNFITSTDRAVSPYTARAYLVISVMIIQNASCIRSACCHCCVNTGRGAGVERRCRRTHRLAVIDSALLFCGRQSGRWRTVAMRDTAPLSSPQPRPQGAPIFCQQVSTFASLLSEFWLNLTGKERRAYVLNFHNDLLAPDKGRSPSAKNHPHSDL